MYINEEQLKDEDIRSFGGSHLRSDNVLNCSQLLGAMFPVAQPLGPLDLLL